MIDSLLASLSFVIPLSICFYGIWRGAGLGEKK